MKELINVLGAKVASSATMHYFLHNLFLSPATWVSSLLLHQEGTLLSQACAAFGVFSPRTTFPSCFLIFSHLFIYSFIQVLPEWPTEGKVTYFCGKTTRAAD